MRSQLKESTAKDSFYIDQTRGQGGSDPGQPENDERLVRIPIEDLQEQSSA